MPSYSVGAWDKSGKVAIFHVNDVADHNEAADIIRKELGTGLALVGIIGGKHPSNRSKPQFRLPSQEELGPPEFA